jgi:hypothetical protein
MFMFSFFPQMPHLFLASSWVTTTPLYRSHFFVDHSLGVIKGSEITLNSENHFLDYDTYSNLSSRTQATFASKRHEIYSLFEIYMKKKRDRREYDAADRYAPRLSYWAFLTVGHMDSRTHTILRSVAQDDMKGQRIDFLFVFPLSTLGPRLTPLETDTLTKSKTTC